MIVCYELAEGLTPEQQLCWVETVMLARLPSLELLLCAIAMSIGSGVF